MTKLTVTLQTVTPAFLGGTDNVAHAEFRLPSLKGVLRYWWRQLQDQTNTQALFEKESHIFGSTARQSRVWLRLLTPPDKLLALEEDSPAQFEHDGIRYLWYSCEQRPPGQIGRKRWLRDSAEVTLEMRVDLSQAKANEVLLALYFTQTFGGLGYRSRRGAGSFQLAVDSGAKFQEFEDLLKIEAKDFIAGYNSKSAATSSWARLISSGSPLAAAFMHGTYFKRFPAASSRTYTTCRDVLNKIGTEMKKFRSVWTYSPTSSDQEACALHAGGNATPPSYTGPDPLTKAAFGLPIIYRFRQRNSSGTVIGHEQWSIGVSPSSHERRASPLFITLKQDASGLPYANLLILWSEFLSPGEQVQMNKIEKTTGKTLIGSVKQPTDAALVSFLNSF